MDRTYPLAPILNLLAAFLVLIPLPYHTKYLNTGVCLFAVWTCAGCLITFVNTIVWHGNIRDGPGWCDIGMSNLDYLYTRATVPPVCNVLEADCFTLFACL